MTKGINHEAHEGKEFAPKDGATGCHTIVTWQTGWLLYSVGSAINCAMNPADLFRKDTDTLQLAPGDFLFREGDKRDTMYVLLEGEVEIRLGEYVVETAVRGALIGEMALIDNSPRAANAVAKTPCRLAAIDQRRFHFLIQQHPHFATHVMKELADRLRRMNAAALR